MSPVIPKLQLDLKQIQKFSVSKINTFQTPFISVSLLLTSSGESHEILEILAVASGSHCGHSEFLLPCKMSAATKAVDEN
jgi:hypothetical protein